MAQKEVKLVEMMEMINYLKRENVDILDIMQLFKEKNMLEFDIAKKDTRKFLSKLTNTCIDDFNQFDDILMQDFLENFERFDFEGAFDFDFLDNTDKTKRYLN